MKPTYLSRKKMMIGGAALVLTVSTLLFAFSFSGRTYAATTSTDTAPRKTMNVTGQGKIQASPDIAYVSMGVVTENTDAKAAQQDNAKSMDGIISQVKSTGVAKEDIKTISYSIYPKYDYNQKTGVSKIVGYTVNNMVQVTVRDITKVGMIIDTAAGNGANVSNNISFGLSDYEKYYREALKQAVTSARGRAESMAGALSITLKDPVAVSEGGGYSPPVISYDMGTVRNEKAAHAVTPVEGGSLEVNASVNMTYEY